MKASPPWKLGYRDSEEYLTLRDYLRLPLPYLTRLLRGKPAPLRTLPLRPHRFLEAGHRTPGIPTMTATHTPAIVCEIAKPHVMFASTPRVGTTAAPDSIDTALERSSLVEPGRNAATASAMSTNHRPAIAKTVSPCESFHSDALR